MDIHEARLLDRLKEYYQAKKEMEECLRDIEELLLLYNFDIEEIAHNYPVLHEVHTPDSNKPKRKIRAKL